MQGEVPDGHLTRKINGGFWPAPGGTEASRITTEAISSVLAKSTGRNLDYATLVLKARSPVPHSPARGGKLEALWSRLVPSKSPTDCPKQEVKNMVFATRGVPTLSFDTKLEELRVSVL